MKESATIPKQVRLGFFLDGGEGGGVVQYMKLLLQHIDRSRFHLTGFYLGPGNSWEVLGSLFDEAVILTGMRLVNVGSPKNSVARWWLLAQKAASALTGVWRLVRALKKHRIAILDVNYYPHHLIAGIACKIAAIPCIWHWHGASIRNRWRTLLTEKGMRYGSDVVVPISHFVKQSLPPSIINKARVVYNGIEADRIAAAQQSGYLKKLTGASNTTRLVGILGTITPLKGHDYFIEAAAIVSKHVTDVIFIVIGSETAAHEKRFHYEAALKKKVQDLHLEKEVLFLDNVPAAWQYLGDCAVICMPTIPYGPVKGEGFGLAMAEAMAAGVPVIATNIGAFPEIVQDGVNGLLIPPKDTGALAEALLYLLKDETARQRLANAGQQRVKWDFDISKTVQGMQQVYTDVLTKNH